MMPISDNTKAILLLTAPLIIKQGSKSAECLTPGEYKKLARCLMAHRHQPVDLLGQGAEALFEKCENIVDRERLQRLLGRGFLLSQAIEKWQSRAVWVLSRADGLYPKRLKTRLREDAPAVIYGCGNPALLEGGGLAVVGSRHV
ncbi:MAG: hypothetical protein RQ739_07765, partial [Desulfotignum sp.]|nr:hypothetical protein [Desulfotignum sp.]